MRPKSLAMLLLALGCGLVASLGITEVVARRNAEAVGPVGETQSIFVAMTDIGLGDLLTSQVLKLEQWPKDKVPPGAVSRIEDVEGRRARTKLYAGEAILENRLLGKGSSGQGATALIPKGYRVVPVKVDLVSGGSSLILPGDRVDVMVHVIKDSGHDIPETVTRTILQDIKVFAVDSTVDLEKDRESNRTIIAKTISLLVTPEQAAKVMLAAQLGTVNLVMRSPEDDQQGANVQARPSDLLGGLLTKSDRDKETLMDSSDPSAKDKTKGFLDLLNTTKAKSPTGGTAAKSKPAETWTVRLLKPGDVQEVTFEAAETKETIESPLGAWKATTTATASGGSQPVPQEKPKAPAPPSKKPSQPKPEPKDVSKNKS